MKVSYKTHSYFGASPCGDSLEVQSPDPQTEVTINPKTTQQEKAKPILSSFDSQKQQAKVLETAPTTHDNTQTPEPPKKGTPTKPK